MKSRKEKYDDWKTEKYQAIVEQDKIKARMWQCIQLQIR